MMICPLSVYDKLRDKSVEEIKSAIRGFKQTIGRLKKKIERERFFPADILICPSDEVILSCTRDYLNMAYQALTEKGMDYILSKAEAKSLEFEENIENIRFIRLRIGEWCQPQWYDLEIIDDKVMFTSTTSSIQIEGKQLTTETLFYGLKRLYIGEWKHYYSPERFGVCILDGIQWDLEIEYVNGKKKTWGGSNDYPYNFEELLSLIGIKDLYDDIFEEEELND